MTAVEHSVTQPETVVPPPGPRPAPAPVPLGWALLASVASGGALLLAFPSFGLFWLAPIGVALLAVATHRRRIRAGFGLGTVAGLALFVPMLQWTHIVAGSFPWLLLSVVQALYIGLLGAACAFASPVVDRRRWTWPLVIAVLWVGQEAVRDRTPFGGFPWGRLAFSQADSPLLRFAVLGGAPLVTFLTALIGGLLALAAWQLIPTTSAARPPTGSTPAHQGLSAVAQGPSAVRQRRSGGFRAALLVAGALAIVALGLAVPTSAPAGRPVEVAIVQGNVPRLGLEFNAQRRAVLDNHVQGTLELARQVRAGTATQPDIVIWPENSSDIDPLVSDDPDDSDAAAEITAAAQAIGVPILVGAVLEGPGANARNAAIVWTPGGGPQSGPHGMYIKRHPVPFAEYIPLRSIARKVTKKVDLVRSDFIGGTAPGVLRMGPVTVGDAICFEVAYDDLVRDTVTGGAQLLSVQTNNADFDRAEAGQQMAMVRLRAVEHGRDALMISTVGISGFVDASGGTHDLTGFNVAATEVRALRLGDQRTLATELGPAPEYVMCAFAVAVLIGAGWLRRRPASAAASPKPVPAATIDDISTAPATPPASPTTDDRNGESS